MFPPVGFPEPPPAPAVPVSGQRALHKSRPRSVDPQVRIIAAQRCSLVWISRTRRSARNSTSSVSSVFTNGLRAFQCPPCRLAGPLRHVHASRVLGLLRDLRPVPRPPAGNGPAHPPDRLPGGEGRPGTVPTFTWNRSMREAPASTPTASPRLRRRPSTWPPHQTNKPASELIPTRRADTRSGADHALHTSPYPSGLSRLWTYGASDSGSSRTPSHHCLPDPDRLRVPTRPVRCQGCSHRRVRSHVPAAPSFTGRLRPTGGGVLSPPPDSRRLVAHCGVPEPRPKHVTSGFRPRARTG